MSNFTKILETLNESKNEYEIKYVDENTIQIYKLTGDYFDITAAKEGDTLSIGKKYTTVKFKPGKEIEINSPTESIDLGKVIFIFMAMKNIK